MNLISMLRIQESFAEAIAPEHNGSLSISYNAGGSQAAGYPPDASVVQCTVRTDNFSICLVRVSTCAQGNTEPDAAAAGGANSAPAKGARKGKGPSPQRHKHFCA